MVAGAKGGKRWEDHKEEDEGGPRPHSLMHLSFIFFFLIEVQLIYNIILIAGVQHNDSKFLWIILHLQLLQYIGCIPCVVQYILVTYLFYTQQLVPLNPLPLSCPSPPSLSPLVTTSLFSTYLSLFLFCYIDQFVSIFQIPHISDIIQCLSFSDISLSIIPSKSIHNVAGDKIHSFLWLSSTPLYLYTSSLSICQLMDTWVASISWLL